jgi:voltage-gated potassium channel
VDRERRAAWLERLERWTDLPLTVLALVLLLALLAPYLRPLTPQVQDALVAVGYAIWALFAADLVIKLAVAPDRLGYLRRRWPDVLLVALPMLRPLRVLRLLLAVSAAARFLTGARRLLGRRGLGSVLLVAVVVVVIAAGLELAVERDEPGASIRSFPDALWWAATTVTTVGYGDTYPTTAAGRGVGVALMLLGIALFGVVTANLAALFVEEQEDATAAGLHRIEARLDQLEATMASILRAVAEADRDG